MRIALVDNEIEAIHTLRDFVTDAAQTLGIDVDTDAFTTSASFLDKFTPATYEIVFLDIFIDNVDGLSLAEKVRELSDSTMIVFCTTSHENMPEAFHFHAFDYLVKPITKEQVTRLLRDISKVLPEIRRTITINANRQEITLPLSELMWSESQGYYLHIKDRSGKKYVTRMTTKELIAAIGDDQRFLLINKGIVVNMDRIKTIEKGSCVMTDEATFPIKIRQAGQIEQIWQNYIFDSLREGQR